jgi:molecular chaperone GrpE
MSRNKRRHTEEDEEAQSAVAVDADEGRKETSASHEGPEGPEGDETGLEARDTEAARTGPDSEIEALRAEVLEMRGLAQRKQAEFENYRRRMERERAELARHAGFELVKEVLPVLDNLERAIQASKSSPEETFRAGVEIIHRQFQEILVRLGLSEVESEGKPFDPHVHEAVSRVATDEHPDGVVVEVFQRGYLFRDRLVRPAMVSVAQAPDGENESREENRGEVAPGPE